MPIPRDPQREVAAIPTLRLPPPGPAPMVGRGGGPAAPAQPRAPKADGEQWSSPGPDRLCRVQKPSLGRQRSGARGKGPSEPRTPGSDCIWGEGGLPFQGKRDR